MQGDDDKAGRTGIEIAIVGLAGRFPGAADAEAFWRNIRGCVESVSSFSDAELRARGVPASALDDPGYVKAGVRFEGFDQFDAGFFGCSPREAEHLDPQQRIFLECAWEALEHAGYDPQRPPGPVGIHAGAGANLYLMKHLLPASGLGAGGDIAELLSLMNGNSADSLATRVAYKLDLRGPAVTVQTACSTSLVAVHMACHSLLSQECDMALAGGVWLNLLQEGGYRYQAGAILSPDGHCRAFDAKAGGTVLGSGAGIVVLRRLDDALRDGDTIHAVIKGSAVNNDGANKVGYTAPGIDGQAEVIRTAQAIADVAPDSIGYVEAHGTGTTLGDPIEMAALTQAFRAGTDRRGFCAIGSVKTNVGHLDAAAGVTGLIKTVMALEHATLPPSLHFETPNPQIDFAASPFFVNTEARAWPAGPLPRRAGVSSFGMGGTNAHVVLEEAPPRPPAHAARVAGKPHLLRLSARSTAAVDAMCGRLAEHLDTRAEIALADVEHTLRVGRKRFEHRAVVLAHDRAGAVRALGRRDAPHCFSARVLSQAPSVAFLFPGQGAQHVQMGRSLYEGEAVFRDTVDRCCRLLEPSLGLDLRTLIHPRDPAQAEATAHLEQTAFTQPALFVVEYAMARLWMHWGLVPDAMLGHSIGEYVAACLAGVFSLEDALALVAARGRLLQATTPGAMLAVSLPEAELQPWLGAGCDLAAVNAAGLCVLSGPHAAIDAAEQGLAQRGAAARRLHVSHAFHSALVEPALAEFESLLRRIDMRAPDIPFVSNLSGHWITAEEACSAGYWARHMRGTVRFADGLAALLAKPDRALLEVGPGETLSSLAKRHPQAGEGRPIIASQSHPQRPELNPDQPARCIAQLWVAGVEIDEAAFGASGEGRRVPLPSYPFERQSYWIAPLGRQGDARPEARHRPRDVADWFYLPAWKRADAAPPAAVAAGACILMLGAANSLSDGLARHLRSLGASVARAEPAEAFSKIGDGRYALRPDDRSDHAQLLRAVDAELGPVSSICHLWSLGAGDMSPSDAQAYGFFSLLALAQALHGAEGERKLSITVVTNRVEDVSGLDPLCPEKATLFGPCRVIPQEHPNIACRVLDVVDSAPGSAAEARLIRQVAAEMHAAQEGEALVAYRGPHRWVRHHAPVRRDQPLAQRLRQSGVYLITGGLGGIGLSLAQHLALRWQASLVLVTRSAWPARADWETLAASKDQPEKLRATLRQLVELEARGARLLILQADVTDALAMQAAVRQARERFGAVHGVIHAAGQAAGGLIAHKTRAAVQAVFAPKLEGTLALLQAVKDEPLDFMLLCSSLSAVAGGFGQVDYCAANAFLDALAAQVSRDGDRFVLSVNWDAWREVGMAAAQALPDGAGIAPAQGAEVLERLLAGPAVAQTLVSNLAIEEQIARMQSTALAERLPLPEGSSQRHARPALQTAYAEPATELEQGLASLWSRFLGISPIGANDNLFELGGDSLLAIQLLAQVRSAYGVELHPSQFFRQPTVAALAVLVELRLIEEIENAGAAADVQQPDRASATV
ncbi:type I polyketide synthase [Variovorax sp. MHTC-1]|uniref:type I polyketide synthase n=1 Tax=Variovorax sp. MHTC-1 TaxID=2495593 RepID=UPI000F862E39|nr:type I polyketide synthase [Variovorax sp. MHTC-1]RST55768.1 SDR family NAD(P)-dependent oxidoreductase [Variovorax sp. MHTC-1]